MIRFLLLGLLFIGAGIGLQRGWIQLNWNQFYSDFGIPVDHSGQPDLFRSLGDSPHKKQR
jgi:hypothetical protein